MAESGFSPEGFARTIASREVSAGRLDPVIGRLEKLTNEYMTTRDMKTAITANKDASPMKQGDDPFEYQDMIKQQAVRTQRDIIQSYGGNDQGEYERSIGLAKTDGERAQVQQSFKERFNPTEIRKTSYGYSGEYGDRQYATPIETVYGIATVENQLFDRISETMTKTGEITDPQNLSPEEHIKIRERIDAQVRQVGMSLLRGITLPNPVGQIFVDKAITDSYNLLHIKPNK